MTQFEFEKLLEKYINGACSREEQLFVEMWSSRQLENVEMPLSESEATVAKTKMLQRINIEANIPRRHPLSIKWLSWTRLGMVAALALLISASIYVFYKSNNTTPSIQQVAAKSGVEVSNITNVAQIIDLKDGSKVTLQPQSSLIYPEQFGEAKRVVYLKGEAFFDVKRDTTKPFLVYSGNLITEVLGTSFNVKSGENMPTAEVLVKSGKVAVYNVENAETGGKSGGKMRSKSVLTPNKKVVFDKKTQQMVVEIVEKPIAVNPPKSSEQFLFREKPIAEVLRYLENVYGLPILIDSKMKDCVFTGDLNGLSFFDQMDLICKATDAHYEKTTLGLKLMGGSCF